MLKPHYFSGFSLLEVLIATFILAFGLLGVTGLYIHSFKSVEDSYWHTLAVSQFITMSESDNVLAQDVFNWREDCKHLLPHGECELKNGRVGVCWETKQNKQCLEP